MKVYLMIYFFFLFNIINLLVSLIYNKYDKINKLLIKKKKFRINIKLIFYYFSYNLI